MKLKSKFKIIGLLSLLLLLSQTGEVSVAGECDGCPWWQQEYNNCSWCTNRDTCNASGLCNKRIEPGEGYCRVAGDIRCCGCYGTPDGEDTYRFNGVVQAEDTGNDRWGPTGSGVASCSHEGGISVTCLSEGCGIDSDWKEYCNFDATGEEGEVQVGLTPDPGYDQCEWWVIDYTTTPPGGRTGEEGTGCVASFNLPSGNWERGVYFKMEAACTPPPAPTNLRTEVGSNGEVAFTWDPPADAPEGYRYVLHVNKGASSSSENVACEDHAIDGDIISYVIPNPDYDPGSGWPGDCSKAINDGVFDNETYYAEISGATTYLCFSEEKATTTFEYSSPASLGCDDACDPDDDKCISPYDCTFVDEYAGYRCRHPNCPERQDCVCDVAPGCPDPVFGSVKKADGSAAPGSLVYIFVKDKNGVTSAPLSAVANDEGKYVIDLGNARTQNFSEYFSYSRSGLEGYSEDIFARGAAPEGTAELKNNSTAHDEPIPILYLNNPPEIEPITEHTATEGQTYTYQVRASDKDTVDTLTYRLGPAPGDVCGGTPIDVTDHCAENGTGECIYEDDQSFCGPPDEEWHSRTCVWDPDFCPNPPDIRKWKCTIRTYCHPDPTPVGMTIDQNGLITWANPTLAFGPFDITVWVSDGKKAVAEEYDLTVEVAVDTEPPDTSIVSGPADGETIYTDSVTFTYTGIDIDNVTATENLVYSYKLDDGTWSDWSTTTEATVAVSVGAHTFYVKAKDEAGLEDPTPAQRAFTRAAALRCVDAVAPKTFEPAPGETQELTATPTGGSGNYGYSWSAEDSAGNDVGGFVGATDEWEATWQAPTDALDGDQFTITVDVTDTVGRKWCETGGEVDCTEFCDCTPSCVTAGSEANCEIEPLTDWSAFNPNDPADVSIPGTKPWCLVHSKGGGGRRIECVKDYKARWCCCEGGGCSPTQEACSDSAIATIKVPSPELYRVTITPDSAELVVGDERDFHAQAYDIDGDEVLGAGYSWSLKEDLGTILVDPDDNRDVTFTAVTASEVREELKVTATLGVGDESVKKEKVATIGVYESLECAGKISPQTFEIEAGETYDKNGGVTVAPEGGSGQFDYSWSATGGSFDDPTSDTTPWQAPSGASPGDTFTLTVTVTDKIIPDTNCSDTATATIIEAQAPTLDISLWMQGRESVSAEKPHGSKGTVDIFARAVGGTDRLWEDGLDIATDGTASTDLPGLSVDTTYEFFLKGYIHLAVLQNYALQAGSNSIVFGTTSNPLLVGDLVGTSDEESVWDYEDRDNWVNSLDNDVVLAGWRETWNNPQYCEDNYADCKPADFNLDSKVNSIDHDYTFSNWLKHGAGEPER